MLFDIFFALKNNISSPPATPPFGIVRGGFPEKKKSVYYLYNYRRAPFLGDYINSFRSMGCRLWGHATYTLMKNIPFCSAGKEAMRELSHKLLLCNLKRTNKSSVTCESNFTAQGTFPLGVFSWYMYLFAVLHWHKRISVVCLSITVLNF